MPPHVNYFRDGDPATYLLMMGPPGAGKGTQAKVVADRYEIPAVSTGDIFRNLPSSDAPTAREVRTVMADGVSATS